MQGLGRRVLEDQKNQKFRVEGGSSGLISQI